MPRDRSLGMRLADFAPPGRSTFSTGEPEAGMEAAPSKRKKKGINPGAPFDPGLDNTGLTYRFEMTVDGKVERWYTMIDRPLTVEDVQVIRTYNFGDEKNLMRMLARMMLCGDTGRHMTVPEVVDAVREIGRFRWKPSGSIAATVERTVARMNLVLSKMNAPFVVSYVGYVRGKPNAISSTQRQYRFFAIEPVVPAKK